MRKEYNEDKLHAINTEQKIGREELSLQQEITEEEVKEPIQNIKIRTAANDGILPEMFKWLGQEGKKWIWEMLEARWKEHKIPWEWGNNGKIIPSYKKGKQTQCENYRAICLAQTTYNLYTRLLEKCLRVYVEQILEK
ncbi:hypothetical protein Trydic_g14479 [Trypoxylus dichotomus]